MGGRIMSETNEETTVVKAAARLFHAGFQNSGVGRQDGRRGTGVDEGSGGFGVEGNLFCTSGLQLLRVHCRGEQSLRRSPRRIGCVV